MLVQILVRDTLQIAERVDSSLKIYISNEMVACFWVSSVLLISKTIDDVTGYNEVVLQSSFTSSMSWRAGRNFFQVN